MNHLGEGPEDSLAIQSLIAYLGRYTQEKLKISIYKL